MGNCLNYRNAFVVILYSYTCSFDQLPFRRYFTLKVPKIYPARLCLLFCAVTYIITCRLYKSGIRRRGRGEQIRGMTADPILLQASVYTAVVIETTAIFLVPFCSLLRHTDPLSM